MWALSWVRQIRYILNQLLREYHDGDNAAADYSDGDIETAIRIHEGDTLPGATNQPTFSAMSYTCYRVPICRRV